jgi:uncharacterized protein YjiS (DUF1127 family)
MTFTSRVTTDHGPEVDVPLDLQVRAHAARARKLQSAAMAEFLANTWHALSRAPLVLVRGLVRWNQRLATREALDACSDRTLADIGIAREHITLVAKGVDHRDADALVQYGWRPRLVTALQHLGFPRPEERRVRRELEAYSDRELNEIGIDRGDIGRIARTA